jgi:hypothetical protein
VSLCIIVNQYQQQEQQQAAATTKYSNKTMTRRVVSFHFTPLAILRPQVKLIVQKSLLAGTLTKLPRAARRRLKPKSKRTSTAAVRHHKTNRATTKTKAAILSALEVHNARAK